MTTSSLEATPIPSRRKVHTWVNHALCILLSLVFLTAAIAKTTAFRELEATLAASKLVSVLLTTQVGVLLVVTEYLVALLLLIPKTRQPRLKLMPCFPTVPLSGRTVLKALLLEDFQPSLDYSCSQLQ